MNDTIILNIPKEKIAFIKNNKANKWTLQAQKNFWYSKYIIVPSPTQKKEGFYLPRLSGIKQGKRSFLKIEFSVPKLIFGNNVDEVSKKDFDNIIKTLRKRLKGFGVHILEENLRKAQVQSFHPSKNFILKNGYTSTGVISELSKIDLTGKMDLTKQTFSNGGQSLQLYSNSHSFVIYDKIADLKKAKGRAIDKDKMKNQPSLFDLLSNKKHFEILRLEVRLSKKVKMNSIMQKLGYAKNPSFEDIFKKNLCQKIVNMYWQNIVLEKNLFIFSMTNAPQQTLNKLMKQNTETKIKQLIYLTGLQQLSTDEMGVRGLENIVKKSNSVRSWDRVKKDFKVLNEAENITECHSWLNQVSQEIDEFKPLKIYDLIM